MINIVTGYYTASFYKFPTIYYTIVKNPLYLIKLVLVRLGQKQKYL